MGHVPVLLHIGHMKVHFIPHFYPFYIIRSEVTSHGRHVNMDFVTFTFNPAISLTQRDVGVRVFFNRVEFFGIGHYHIGGDNLGIMGLSLGGKIQ